MHFCRTALALVLVASLPSCAMFASANAKHSHISPCVDDATFAVIDLILAAGITGGLAASGELDGEPKLMLIPGVFVASGIIGAIGVARCRSSHKDEQSASAPFTPGYDGIPYAPPKPSWNNPVEADGPPEELLVPAGDPVQPARPAVDLKIDPDNPIVESPLPKPDGKIPCEPGGACPGSFSCRIVAEHRGYCVAD